jgi:hypothetical protein
LEREKDERRNKQREQEMISEEERRSLRLKRLSASSFDDKGTLRRFSI